MLWLYRVSGLRCRWLSGILLRRPGPLRLSRGHLLGRRLTLVRGWVDLLFVQVRSLPALMRQIRSEVPNKTCGPFEARSQ